MGLKVFLYFLLSIAMIQAEADYIRIPQSEVPKFLGISLNCVGETGADADTLYKLMTWTGIKKNPNMTKFMYCFLTKSNYANADGRLLKDKIVHLVGNHKRKDEFAKVMEECNKLEGKDKYDRLFNISECTHDKSPILFSL